MALKKMDSVLDLACRCLLEIKERCILQFRKYELDYERSKRPLMSHLKKHQMFGGPNFLCLVHIFLQPHLFSILLRKKNCEWSLREALLKKNGKRRGHCPLLATPPLNGSKGDICCLITDKSK